MKIKTLVLVSVLALGAVACSDKPEEPSTTEGQNVVNATDSLTFDPAKLTVKSGDVVEFKNKGSILHSVTLADKSFDKDLAEASSVTYTPTKAGEIAYTCKYHAGMRGTLVVT